MHHLQTKILEETPTHICSFVHTTDFAQCSSRLAAFGHRGETVNPGFIEHPAEVVLRAAVIWCGLSRNTINGQSPMQPSPTNVSSSRPIEASSAHPSLSASSKRLLPWLIAVAFFIESLDITILNTAVPTIAAAVQVAPLSMKSVLASYTLSPAIYSNQRLGGGPVRNALYCPTGNADAVHFCSGTTEPSSISSSECAQRVLRSSAQ